MKCGVALALLAALAVPAFAYTARGVISTGSYFVMADSIKFAVPTGVVTIIPWSWGGGPGIRDTEVFTLSGSPVALMLFYKVADRGDTVVPQPVTAPYAPDSVYHLPIGTLPPHWPFPELRFLGF